MLAKSIIKLAAFIALLPSITEQAMACASCGSGSGSPLILYPNEKIKTYLGIQRQSSIESVSRNGTVSTAAEPETKTTLNLAFGFRPTSRIAIVYTQPYLRNEAEGTAKTGTGDPSLESRLTLEQGAWDRPAVPQIQTVVGHKFSVAPSIHKTKDLRQRDVFGNGFDETGLGMDIWWNMLPAKPGLAVITSRSWPRSYSGIEVERGLRTQVIVGIGHTIAEQFHLNGGLRIDQKAKDKTDGNVITDSDSRQNDFFASCRWSHQLQEITLSLFWAGIGNSNKNSVRSKSLSLGWAYAIPE